MNCAAWRARWATKSRLLRQTIPDDLLQFGMIPEFVGRVPVVVSIEPVDEEMMMRILVEPKNAIMRQYQRLFEIEDVALTFTEDALRAAARQALRRRIGARGPALDHRGSGCSTSCTSCPLATTSSAARSPAA